MDVIKELKFFGKFTKNFWGGWVGGGGGGGGGGGSCWWGGGGGQGGCDEELKFL